MLSNSLSGLIIIREKGDKFGCRVLKEKVDYVLLT